MPWVERRCSPFAGAIGNPAGGIGKMTLSGSEAARMADGPPKLIAVEHDDYHAQHVGRMADGRQFFLTKPFEPAIGGRAGNEFIALFLFDDAGKLLDAKIDQFGPRANLDYRKRRQVYEERLRELGDVSFERIEGRAVLSRTVRRDLWPDSPAARRGR